MCGRYTLTHAHHLAKHLSLAEPKRCADLPPRYNIAPTQPVAAVFDENQSPQLLMMRWGLIPEWMKPQEGNTLPQGWFNARAETLHEKPAFRAAYRYRRCLIPADGFYEWPRQGGTKIKGATPHLFRPTDDGLMMFAGVFTWWSSPDGSELPTCAIVTTTPNTLMASLHDRMPVVLQPEDYTRWTDMRSGNDPRDLLRPAADGTLYATAVSSRVGNVRHDDPACLAPAPPREQQGGLFD